jgi:hypothetical protein
MTVQRLIADISKDIESGSVSTIYQLLISLWTGFAVLSSEA